MNKILISLLLMIPLCGYEAHANDANTKRKKKPEAKIIGKIEDHRKVKGARTKNKNRDKQLELKASKSTKKPTGLEKKSQEPLLKPRSLKNKAIKQNIPASSSAIKETSSIPAETTTPNLSIASKPLASEKIPSEKNRSEKKALEQMTSRPLYEPVDKKIAQPAFEQQKEEKNPLMNKSIFSKKQKNKAISTSQKA